MWSLIPILRRLKCASYLGYYARFYPASGIYVGIKDGHVYVTGGSFGGEIVDLGQLEGLFNQAGL